LYIGGGYRFYLISKKEGYLVKLIKSLEFIGARFKSKYVLSKVDFILILVFA